MLLTTERRTAKEQFAAKLRAENNYKAKKRSAAARQHRDDTKTHFKAGFSHLWQGLKSCGSMIISLPWIIRGWKAERQESNEKKSAERYEKQKMKLEAKMAKTKGAEEAAAAA